MSTVQDGSPAPEGDKTRARPKGKRSGSENRRPSKVVTIRYPLSEHVELERRASALGVTLSAYMRLKASGIEPPRSTTPDQKLSIQHLAQLGKIGSNINQIARAANMNEAGLRDIDYALEQIRALGQLLRQILRGGA